MSPFSSPLVQRGTQARGSGLVRDACTVQQISALGARRATAASGRTASGPKRSRDVSSAVLMTPSDIAGNVCSVCPPSPSPCTPSSAGDDLGWSTDFRCYFAVSKLLGQGSFGLVHEGVDLRSGSPVAVKVMPKTRANVAKERLLERLRREIDILERLQVCPNVVRLGGCFEDEDNVQIVMEICDGGDLQKHVESHGPLDERAAAAVAVEILKIVAACHELGVLHGDVKPANFCLADPHHNPMFSPDPELAAVPWLKALDFGCSQNLEPSKRLFKRSGTPVYMAPEIYARDYSQAADMWSFGITMYWMFAGRFPFFPDAASVRVAKLEDVVAAVASAPMPMDYGVWNSMSPEGLDFVSRCLERDESRRLTAREALDHPWLQAAVLASRSLEC